MSERQLQGSCLCGFATYTVRDAFEYALICHCSQCRRATGAAAKPFGGIPAAMLTVENTDHILLYGEGVAFDAHCQRCGSLLYSSVRGGAYVHVTLGTLRDPPSRHPSAHIHVGSKATWDIIGDGLPQFDELP